MDPPHPTAIKNSLEGDSQAELESLDSGRALAYPDVSSTYDPKTRRVFLNVLNRSEKQDIAAQISSRLVPLHPVQQNRQPGRRLAVTAETQRVVGAGELADGIAQWRARQ